MRRYLRPRSEMTTGAPDGPLTIAEGKLRAGLDWVSGDPRDALMTGFIRAARAKVEKDTGVALVEQTFVWGFDTLYSGDVLELPLRPATEVVIEHISADGLITTALPPEAVIVEQHGATPVPARIRLYASTWPSDLRTFAPWTVEVTVGFASAEDLAAAAPELLHAVGLLTAHYATHGRDLAIVGTIVALTPFGYDDLIAPYQLVSI